MQGCKDNLPSGIECREVCKYSPNMVSSEQAPVQAEKPVEKKPAEKSVSDNPWNECDLHCIAYLMHEQEIGVITDSQERVVTLCNEHFCHGTESCMQGCKDNLASGVDCNQVCKYSPNRVSSERKLAAAEKPVEEKPAENSVSGYPWNDCDLHCIAYLMDEVQKGVIVGQDAKSIAAKCNEHLCHVPMQSCMQGCSDNFPRAIDCRQVCRGAGQKTAEALII